MPKQLPDIEYKEDIVNDKLVKFIDSPKSLYIIPLTKDEEYFSNIDSYQKFAKAVEKLVRVSDRYSKYKAYLRDEAKLDHCQVLKDITSEDAEIEMHHGPIFTLFDYVCVMIEYFIQMKWKITTFRIADQILKEHEENHIQVVMLSSTIHEKVHDKNIFIHPSQAFGDLNAFINKYYSAIGRDLREKYNRYWDRAKMTESTDYGTLELNKKLWT